MRASARTLLAAFQVVVLTIWTAFWIGVALLSLALTRRQSIPLAMARKVWAPGVLRTLGTRLEVDGLERVDLTQPYLFVSNHGSQLDIPVMFAALPTPLRFLAKAELRKAPLLGRYIAAMGMVFIDRGDPEAARASIDRVAELLRSGASLLAFPEGTRSRGSEVRPFKTGAFVAAIKAQVPVVAVRILGSAELLPPGSLVCRSGTVIVKIAEPVATSNLAVEDRRRLADEIRQKVVDLGLEGDGEARQGERVANSST